MALPPGDDRYDHFISEKSFNNYPHGYPRLASFINSDAEGHIYRRFGQLRSRLLLHLQDEICDLEDKLTKLDQEHEQCDADRIRLHSRRWDERDSHASERKELIRRLDERLEHYDNVLLRQDSLLRLMQTPKSLHRQYFNWIYNEKPLVKDEYSFIYREEDFVSLGVSEGTWLAPLVKDIARVTPTCLSRLLLSSSKNSEPDDILHFSDARTQKFVKAIVGLISALMLLIPVSVFYVLSKHHIPYGGRIGALCGFTIAFNAALLILTNISKHELFGASAGYCAVLVVS